MYFLVSEIFTGLEWNILKPDFYLSLLIIADRAVDGSKDLGNICYFFIFYWMKDTEYFDSFDILYFTH